MFKFDLLENETVLNIYRQSETVLFRPVIIVFALIYFPWYFLIKYELAASFSRLLLFWTILVLTYAVNKYLLWLLNVYLVTDRRLACINYKSLFNKSVVESPLEKILNVSFSQNGFWQSLFGYGTVAVQVAGLSQPLAIKNVPQPSEVKDFLWTAHNSKRAAAESPHVLTQVPPSRPKLSAGPRPRRMDL